ncbi:hypothetical protein SAMN06313540_11215 [Epsilonproteobacteria bacterium SCGC AD-308-E02]|jgi:hypothetical protein|nr:hypothetical protein SAMN06313540_11215 [Epsilonproteobacteria bacterium SCGC AD-308-E02]
MNNDKAISILQANNVSLATGISKICQNVLEKMVEFSEDVQSEKQALQIVDVVQKVQTISGLASPKQVDVSVTNKYVNGFDFIEITAEDIIESEQLEYKSKERVEDEA